MKKLVALAILVSLALSVSIAPTEAGWKKRGWYQKTQKAACRMRQVVVRNANGKIVVKTVRVCG